MVLKNRYGGITQLTDENGTIVKNYVYDAFGKGDNVLNVFRYCGEYFDEETDNYYLRARYYDPSTGRFTQEDPIRDGLNWYSYCAGNPISYIDPSGTTQISDTKYTYTTQIDIIGYSILYNNAKRKNDKAGMNAATKAANALRTESNKPSFWDGWGKEQAGYFEMATIAAFDVADKSGYAKNSLEYGEVATEYLRNFVIDYIKTNNEYNSEMLQVFLAEVYPISPLAGQCFTEETLIKAKQGYKKIVDIKIGDKVLSENEKTGEIDYKPVKELFENKTDVLIKVYVSDEEIKTTENHPFYVENKGWCYAKDLKIGDNLKLANGESKLVENIRIEILTKPIKVYNFEVKDWHTYFVTDEDILVHNICDWHRMTSKESMKAAKELGFEKTGQYTSNKEPIYYNRKTKTYISQDIGSADGSGPHNGGVWKQAKSIKGLNSKQTRMGTYDKNLKRIGD